VGYRADQTTNLMAWDMWQHRNKVLHKSEENRNKILEAEVNSQIKDLYTKGPRAFGSQSQTVMKQTESALIQLPLAYKKQWVATVQITHSKFKKQ